MTANLRKINFKLTPDEDDYPPATVESVWALPLLDDGLFQVDNIPFFTCDAALGDVVECKEVDGENWFSKIITPSLNSLIRVVFFDVQLKPLISDDLKSLGCLTEYFEKFGLLAISVPPTVQLSSIQEYLQDQAAKGGVDYEEAILRQ